MNGEWGTWAILTAGIFSVGLLPLVIIIAIDEYKRDRREKREMEEKAKAEAQAGSG